MPYTQLVKASAAAASVADTIERPPGDKIFITSISIMTSVDCLFADNHGSLVQMGIATSKSLMITMFNKQPDNTRHTEGGARLFSGRQEWLKGWILYVWCMTQAATQCRWTVTYEIEEKPKKGWGR